MKCLIAHWPKQFSKILHINLNKSTFSIKSFQMKTSIWSISKAKKKKEKEKNRKPLKLRFPFLLFGKRKQGRMERNRKVEKHSIHHMEWLTF